MLTKKNLKRVTMTLGALALTAGLRAPVFAHGARRGGARGSPAAKML